VSVRVGRHFGNKYCNESFINKAQLLLAVVEYKIIKKQASRRGTLDVFIKIRDKSIFILFLQTKLL